MHDRERIAKHKPTGPYAPPLPKEVDQEGPEPMAVARDKDTPQDRSFQPTTASKDQFAPDVARRYKQVPEAPGAPEHGGPAASEEETNAMQKPPGYTEPNERGWSKLREQQGEK